MSSCYLFPTSWTVRMAALIETNEHRVWKLLSEVSLSVVLATLLALALNKRLPESTHVFHKSLVDTFLRVRYAGSVDFSEVRTGHYFSHPVCSSLCHVFSQLVFLHVFVHVISPSLALAIVHICDCVLVSISGQTTLVFHIQGKC